MRLHAIPTIKPEAAGYFQMLAQCLGCKFVPVFQQQVEYFEMLTQTFLNLAARIIGIPKHAMRIRDEQ